MFQLLRPSLRLGNTSNYPCGCVATAMSQVMYYFEFPTTGVGTGNFGITINGTNTTANLRGGDGDGGRPDRLACLSRR